MRPHFEEQNLGFAQTFKCWLGMFADERVSSTLKTQIVKARTAKKLTQAQLAQAINEKPQVIQEYESGKAIPNPQVLSKLSRILGVQLKK
eukprot:1159924-Pelagomonas_calceolata.AAC.2